MAWSVDEVRTYNYTGSVQTVSLDPGSYKLECWGAQGRKSPYNAARNGGKGGYVTGELSVVAETDANIYVGNGADLGAGQPGGYNGGGNGSTYISNAHGGGGGGGTDIRVGGTAIANRIIAAGGGGGCGYLEAGINGGSLTGGNGVLWQGSNAPGNGAGGGGGGNYGGNGGATASKAGFGGTSYYSTLSNPSSSVGVKEGAGEVKITCLSLDGGGVTKRRRFAQFI